MGYEAHLSLGKEKTLSRVTNVQPQYPISKAIALFQLSDLSTILSSANNPKPSLL